MMRRDEGANEREIWLPSPFHYQQEILDDPHRIKVIDVGRQAGKTTLCGFGSVKGHGPLMEDGMPMFQGALQGKQGSWIAPTYDLADISWRRIKEWIGHEIWSTLRKSDQKRDAWVEFPGGGRLSMRSADDPEKLVGDTLDFLVIDEAAKAKPGTWELSQIMLSVRNTERLRGLRLGGGWAFIISTPKGRNWFYKLWKLGNPKTDQIKVSELAAIELEAKRAASDMQSWQLPSTVSPLFSQEEFDRLKRVLTPFMFEREVLARFTVADGNFFRRKWFKVVPDKPIGEEVFLTASLPIDEEARGEVTAAGEQQPDNLVVAAWSNASVSGLTMIDLHRSQCAPAEIPGIISDMGAKHNAAFLAVAHLEPLASMSAMIGKSREMHRMGMCGIYDGPCPDDAAERVAPAAAAIFAERMRFLEADYLEEFMAELFSFPDPDEERGCPEVIALAARARPAA